MIKICGLKDRVAIDAAIAAGADAIGFVFADSIRRVTPAEAAALAAGMPSHVRRVAVMRHPDESAWRAVLREFEPQVLQTDAADFATLDVPDAVERWPVYREGGSANTLAGELPATFLYEGQKSGSGEPVDWARAAKLARRGRLILAGGLNAANVADAIRQVRPWGIDVSSAVESAPGRKDPARIAAFIAAAQGAFDAGRTEEED
ncbi:MAG: phosphoribosylanthranilate isomerase [Woeseiaceae bacterium]|nr:phosphoribosylanthranilate isomerase [Woeseiaceae bacterium]